MRCVLMGGLVLALSPVLLSAAEAGRAPVIPAYERFLADRPGDPAAGRLLLGELGCVSCHAAASDEDFPEWSLKQAPILTDVGRRVRPEWIAKFLRNPAAMKPGTTMPHPLHGVTDEAEIDTIVTALTHFLVGESQLWDSYPDPAGAKRGETLFHRSGCVACHNPRSKDAPNLETSVPLGDLAAKYTVGTLAEFLADPLHVRPSGRMPSLGLQEEAYRDLAAYFLLGIDIPPNVRYEVYHGSWDKLPNFDELKPAKTGEGIGFDLTVAEKTSSFGIRFQTKLYIPQDGRYQIHLRSDDGSQVVLDGNVVVDLDGIHPVTERTGRLTLEQGWHDLQVLYFQGGGEWVLEADISGPGMSRQSLASLCSVTGELPKPDDGFAYDPELAEQGKKLFIAGGCNNCHLVELKQEKPSDIPFRAYRWPAPALAELDATKGCLSDEPPKTVPLYPLSDAQRRDLTAAVQAAASGNMQAMNQAATVHQTLLALNCYACHQRGEIGGVEPQRDAYFQTTMKEMGDEGRLPPTLTGVGDKLQTGWMEQLLRNGTHERPYMHTRMPKFGNSAAVHLAKLFEQLDRKTAAPEVTIDEPAYRIKADGRYLIGDKALSCIKCHDFAQYPATGIRAISLTSMTSRLRQDWFHRYMLNPQAYRPGTRMPAAWPFGQSTIHEVLDGDANKQIVAVWTYLTDGNNAAIPTGLVRKQIELVAEEEPIIYRNFIEGAGPRGIGVGYPEKANLAFDANNLRLAMIWHGAFIDASRHWNGRGNGFEGPLGDHVLRFPDAPALAALTSDDEPWPQTSAREGNYEFLGYSLDDKRRPIFRYSGEGVSVTDHFVPVKPDEADALLERRLTFEPQPEAGTTHFRLAVANRIEPGDATGEYVIDGAWRLVIDASSGIQPQLRSSGGRPELLLKIPGGGTVSRTAVQYIW